MKNAKNYDFIQADIRNYSAIKTIITEVNPDAVLHLAAESHVDRSIDGPNDFIDTNINGTTNLLEACRINWVHQNKPETFRFHHVSTDEVYGTLGNDGQFNEQSSYAPNSPYAASKASSDMLVRAWHKTYGLPTLTSNCSNNYGYFQFPEKLIPVVILSILSKQPIPIYGNGKNSRDWLHVDDHVDALLTILENGVVGRNYNIGGNEELTNIDLVRKICTIMDRLAPSQSPHLELATFVPDRPGHDFRYAIDSSRIRDELGWQPMRPLDEGLEETIMWYINNQGWWQPLLSRRRGIRTTQQLTNEIDNG